MFVFFPPFVIYIDWIKPKKKSILVDLKKKNVPSPKPSKNLFHQIQRGEDHINGYKEIMGAGLHKKEKKRKDKNSHENRGKKIVSSKGFIRKKGATNKL